MSAEESNYSRKKYEITGAKLIFSDDAWEKIVLSDHEILLKPKYMIRDVDWYDVPSVRDSKVPFLRVIYSNGTICRIEASSGAVRENPVFHRIQDKDIILSDCPRKLLSDPVEFDEVSLYEFLAFGYVTSNRTLFKNVYSLEAGDTLHFGVDGISIETKYLYNSCPILELDYHDLLDRLQEETETIFNSLIKVLKGKSVLLPLSAGYDSRFIASMLKMGDFQDVTCFAWGRPGNKDIEISKVVARQLGLKWEEVNYSEQNWKDVLGCEWIQPLLVDSSKYVSISGAASLPFQKLLRERGIDNCVVIPGHSGDFTAGGHLPATLNKNCSKMDVIDYIMRNHLLAVPKKNHEQILTELTKKIDEYCLYTDPYRTYEMWDQRERQCKFIVNTNRYYEVLGIGWAMPLWDFRFTKFWDQVPLRYKKNSVLYHDFLENNIFKKANVDFGLKVHDKSILYKMRPLLEKSAQRLKVNRLIQLVKLRSNPHDEYGFYLSLPYIYNRTRQSQPRGFDLMSQYNKRFGFGKPQKQYEFLVRSVLAMILESI